MAKFKAKAEQMFELKAQRAIELRDWNLLTEVGQQYEAYLKLIAPVEELSVKKELQFVGHNEPSREQEFVYVASGEHARFCVEVLHREPITLVKIDPERFPTYQAFLDRYISVENQSDR